MCIIIIINVKYIKFLCKYWLIFYFELDIYCIVYNVCILYFLLRYFNRIVIYMVMYY